MSDFQVNDFSILQKLNELTERVNKLEDEQRRSQPPKRIQCYKAKRPAKTIN